MSECTLSSCPSTDDDDLSSLSKEDLIKLYQKDQSHMEQLKTKLNHYTNENTEKDKNAPEISRRENVLVMRLANKEQEVQELIAQINHSKKVQEDAALLSLQQTNLDPGINLLFGKMREELQQTKSKLEQAQSELSAWKFTPDSQNGKKLISRCRTLIAENQELGRQISQGKTAQLEAELALQKKYSEELKASQDELNEFVIQLDEEVEEMQSAIQVLQQQLVAAKNENENYEQLLDSYKSELSLDDEREYLEKSVKRERAQSTATGSDDNSDANCDPTDTGEISDFFPSNEGVGRIKNKTYYRSDSNKDPKSDDDFPPDNEAEPLNTKSRTRSLSSSPRQEDVYNEYQVYDSWNDKASNQSGEHPSDSEADTDVENEQGASDTEYNDQTRTHVRHYPLSKRSRTSKTVENSDDEDNYENSEPPVKKVRRNSNLTHSNNDTDKLKTRSPTKANSISESHKRSDFNSNSIDELALKSDRSSLLAYCKKMLSQPPESLAVDKTLLAKMSEKLSTFAEDGNKELDLNSLQILKNAIQNLLTVDDDSHTDNGMDDLVSSKNSRNGQ